MQGVYVVFANEAVTGDELVAIPVESPVTEEVSDPAVISDASVAELEQTDTPDVTQGSVSEAVVAADVSQGGADEKPVATGEVASTSESTPSEDTSPGVAGSEGLATETSQDTTLDQSPDDSTVVDGVVDTPEETAGDVNGIDAPLGSDATEDASDATLATTTENFTETTSTVPLGPGLTESVSVNYSDSGFTFSKSECTELASGSFYCLEPRENVLEDALFAAPDKDGDLEIFLVRNGTQTQVTDNFVDDAAPFFDQNSETIVWHRLIDDRYQIISYDLASGEEVQLTHGSANNMEPMRQGRYTVWQRWVNNNWEIMLSDGSREVQVSHASAHDIAPYIHGSLVVWNRYGATGEKTIEMYDIKSETYVTVDDPEGLSVSNPRMVLVYDQLHPNGDIVTKGYDMIARRFIQLDTLPRELPDEIPASEPTSETRALIQAKPTLKSDEIVVDESASGGEPPLPPTATSSDPLTLDMTATTTLVTVDTTVAELSDFDLVVPPLETTLPSGTDGVQE